MGKELIPLIGFFVLIIFLSFAARDGGLQTTPSQTGSSTPNQGDIATPPNSVIETNETTAHTPSPRLSNDEIERKLASLYRELDSLTKELRSARLREPESPYVDMVDLRSGNARGTDPKSEYLTIHANTQNTEPINVSNWYIESYVTNERVALPTGDRILERWRRPNPTNILLEPGEHAYLMTAESPINVSFRENMCTGYLSEETAFYPSLSRSCPSPLQEMEKFGNIDLDDDSCFDFVERINYCTEVDDAAIDTADLSGACRRFIVNTLSHDDCVAKHRYDPFFDDVGMWHIYLDRDEDLWRSEREIIRLMDENDRVIDVLEY